MGRFLNVQRNFFARQLLHRALPDASRITFKACTDPFPARETRMGTHVFPWALQDSDIWLQEIEQNLEKLRKNPTVLVHAMKDAAFGSEEIISRWKGYLPDAAVHRIANGGHYIQEDLPNGIADTIRLIGYKVK